MDKGGEAGEEEARQNLVCLRQKIEMSGEVLADAAGRLGERFGGRWVMRKESAMGIVIGWQTKQEVLSIFRSAAITEVMSGNVSGLLGSRRAVQAARKEANAEIYKAGGRDGRDRQFDISDGFDCSAEWEEREEFSGQGRMPRGNSSAPDRSAGHGLRPSIADELQGWVYDVNEAFAARIKAASTPQAVANSKKSASKSVELVSGLMAFANGGNGPDPELMSPFFPGGELDRPITGAGRVRLHRLRKVMG